jgi:hypothetical protein
MRCCSDQEKDEKDRHDGNVCTDGGKSSERPVRWRIRSIVVESLTIG